MGDSVTAVVEGDISGESAGRSAGKLIRGMAESFGSIATASACTFFGFSTIVSVEGLALRVSLGRSSEGGLSECIIELMLDLWLLERLIAGDFSLAAVSSSP
jgi:hypothetical protein